MGGGGAAEKREDAEGSAVDWSSRSWAGGGSGKAVQRGALRPARLATGRQHGLRCGVGIERALPSIQLPKGGHMLRKERLSGLPVLPIAAWS